MGVAHVRGDVRRPLPGRARDRAADATQEDADATAPYPAQPTVPDAVVEPAPVPYQVPGPDVEPPPLHHLRDSPGHAEPQAGLAHRMLALLVIAALIALIVFLVLRGLAR